MPFGGFTLGADGEASPKSKRASEAYRRLKGPLASVTIPYSDDGSIDFESLSRWVDFVCEQQVPVLFMTLGDTELDFLTEAEIEAVIRAVVKDADGRALVCGGTGPWAPRQSIEFIRRIGDSGVDAVNLHFTRASRQQPSTNGRSPKLRIRRTFRCSPTRSAATSLCRW